MPTDMKRRLLQVLGALIATFALSCAQPSILSVNGSTLNAGSGPLGGIGSSALATLAASMSANTWQVLTVTNTMNLDPSSTGNNFFSYSPRGEWDPVNKKAWAWGGCHGNTANVQRGFTGAYLDGTNAYMPTPIGIPGTVTTSAVHGYFTGAAVDSNTGDLYGLMGFAILSNLNQYRVSDASWQTPFPSNSTLGAHSTAAAAVVYNPGIYSTGGVITASQNGIWSSPLPRNGTPSWTIILDRTLTVDAMGDFPAGTYVPKDGCAYVGGGSSTTNLWQICGSSGAGTPVQVAYPPATLYNSPTIGFFAGGDPTHGLTLMTSAGVVYSYDKASNTWSTVSTTVPSGLLNTLDSEWVPVSVPDYKVVIFMQGGSGGSTTTTNLYVWKY